jgi:hypothetical protein
MELLPAHGEPPIAYTDRPPWRHGLRPDLSAVKDGK